MSYRKEVRELIDKAAKLGFVVDEKKTNRQGGGHIILVHSNGSFYVIATSPSDWRGAKNSIADMERLSGKKLERVSHKRSRKAVKRTDFSLDKARRERNERAGAAVDRLMDEREDLIEKFKFYAGNGKPCEHAMQKMIVIVRRIGEIEAILKELRQPVTPFHPIDVI
jgi:hypothetical protein